MKTVMSESSKRLKRLNSLLSNLTGGQLDWIEQVAEQFGKPYTFERWADSDLINESVLQDFGDALRIHHCFSAESFQEEINKLKSN